MHDVLNWVGQGTMVGLATFVLLRALDRSKAWARYALCWIALLVVFLLPFVPPGFGTPIVDAAASSDASAAGAVIAVPTAWWTSRAIVAALWLLWIGVFAVRAGNAWLSVRRARAGCHEFPATIEATLHHWTHVKSHGRPAPLAISPETGSAAVLGCGFPVIVVSPSLVEHLTSEELDRVVVHEWAHVQRRDDLLNVLQMGVRALAGWHPAVWWLGRQLLIEREIACDERAVALTGSPKAYATSLTRVAALAPVGRAHLASVGALSSSALRKRILRIISRHRRLSAGFSAFTTTCAALLLACGSVSLGGVRLFGSAPTPASHLPAATSSPFVPVPAAVRGADTVAIARPGPSPIRRRPQQAPLVVLEAPPGDLSPQTATGGSDPVPDGVNTPDLTALTSAPLPANASDLGSVSTGRIAGAVVRPSGRNDSVPSPWAAAAGAGAAIGRGSQKAGLATANFFSRAGKKIARSF